MWVINQRTVSRSSHVTTFYVCYALFIDCKIFGSCKYAVVVLFVLK